MKKIKNLIPFAGILLFSSCLDLQPISEIGEGSFYKNDAEVNVGVISCYNGLHNTLDNEWMLTDLRTDVSRLKSRTSQTSINKDLMALDESIAYAGHVEIERYWTRVYHNIARCNTILRESNVVIDPVLKKQFVGEVLFLRSYHYFNLVRLFGPLFIVTERISAAEARQYNRSSVESVYAQIVGDLTNVINNNMLPASYPKEAGRITKWAAKTLLAKVYLTRGNPSEAKMQLEDVKGSVHGLLASYDDVFSTLNEMNKEILFAVRYKSGNYGLGNPFGNYFAPLTSGNNVINSDGSGQNYPTLALMNAYGADGADARKPATVSEKYFDKTKDMDIQEYYVTKYLSPVTIKGDGEKDVPVLRYADVLLMLAEIENEINGPTQVALDYLNEIRKRAKVTEFTLQALSNKHAFRLALENERLLEFAYENQRFFDLVRTNRYIDVMNKHYVTELIQFTARRFYLDTVLGEVTKPVEEWQLLLPIPTSERDINPNITQNPGY